MESYEPMYEKDPALWVAFNGWVPRSTDGRGGVVKYAPFVLYSVGSLCFLAGSLLSMWRMR